MSIGATDPAVFADPELYDLALPIVQADFKAIETYQHRHGLKTRCPVVVLTGTDDPEVDLQEAIAWRDHAGNEFALHRFSGGHFFIDQHTDKVLDIVREVLSREFLPPSPRGRPSLVTVSGLKVDLTEVETVLRAHPRVSETVVVHHEVIEGCVGGEAPPDVSELLVWCEERLSAVKLPGRFFSARELPRTKSGKLVRDWNTIRSGLGHDLDEPANGQQG